MLKNLSTIIGYFRGQEGITRKQALQALLAILTFGVEQFPDTGMPAVPAKLQLKISTPEELIVHLEKVVAVHKDKVDHDPEAMIALPWETIIPLFLGLLKKWLGNKK